MSIWDNPEIEEQRYHKRELWGRIAYDCYHLKLADGRAYCSKGHFALDMSTEEALRGDTPGVCLICRDYDDGGKQCV